MNTPKAISIHIVLSDTSFHLPSNVSSWLAPYPYGASQEDHVFLGSLCVVTFSASLLASCHPLLIAGAADAPW